MVAMAATQPRTLFVFDFDHTLVDDNTDTWVLRVRPALGLLENLAAAMQTEVAVGEGRKQRPCWTELMDSALGRIHAAGCGSEELLAHMRRLTMFEEALKAVRAAREAVRGARDQIIIISDSNSVFIETVLRKSGMEDAFGEVFTNPAHFDPSGRLHVSPHSTSKCARCVGSPGMCKGDILTSYLSKQGGFDRIVYVGDGRNDVCPCLRLMERDHVVCRKGYALARALEHATDLRASLHVVDFVASLGSFMCSMFPPSEGEATGSLTK